MSNSKGMAYFYNNDSKVSSWDAPPDLSESEIQQLPGAHLLSEGAVAGRVGQVRASHILVKHAGSRRPSSWKEVRVGSRKSGWTLT
jgi:NIMA-interacting peptidyl-prolyl cis-trans isomerase 1